MALIGMGSEGHRIDLIQHSREGTESETETLPPSYSSKKSNGYDMKPRQTIDLQLDESTPKTPLPSIFPYYQF